MTTLAIDIASPTVVDPFTPGVWDSTDWDQTDAFWGGVMPSWEDMTCRVISVETDAGRADVLSVFEPGRAVVRVLNEDGWASWAPDQPNPVNAGAWLRVRVIDAQGDHVLFTGRIQAVSESYDPGGPLTADFVCVDFLARLAAVELPGRAPVGAGDTVAQRIQRCLDEIFWPPELTDLDPGVPTRSTTRRPDKS